MHHSYTAAVNGIWNEFEWESIRAGLSFSIFSLSGRLYNESTCLFQTNLKSFSCFFLQIWFVREMAEIRYELHLWSPFPIPGVYLSLVNRQYLFNLEEIPLIIHNRFPRDSNQHYLWGNQSRSDSKSRW